MPSFARAMESLLPNLTRISRLLGNTPRRPISLLSQPQSLAPAAAPLAKQRDRRRQQQYDQTRLQGASRHPNGEPASYQYPRDGPDKELARKDHVNVAEHKQMCQRGHAYQEERMRYISANRLLRRQRDRDN